MGLRGPKSDPSRPNSRSKSKGNRRVGSTAYNAAQTRKLEAGEPEKPSYLTGTAAAIWDQTVPLLFAAKLIHPVDLHTMASYCLDVATYADNAVELNKPRGEVKYSEAERKSMREEAKEAWARAKAVGELMGMSPKSRTAMGISATGGGGVPGGAEVKGGGASGGNNGSNLAFVLTGQR